MCMNFLNQTEIECCRYLDFSPVGKLTSVLNNQWDNSDAQDGDAHLLVPELKLLGLAVGGGGLRQAGGWGSSENSVYVAFLKSRRSFTGLGEHHWWKYMHWDQMLERLPKKRDQNRYHVPIIKARMLLFNWGWSHVVWIGEGRDVCWPATSDKRIVISPRWPHIFTRLTFLDLILESLLFKYASQKESFVPHFP